MRIDILTLFPEMCRTVMNESIIGRAQKAGKVCHRRHIQTDAAQFLHAGENLLRRAVHEDVAVVHDHDALGHLGGVFHAAAAPSFKEKDKQLLAWYEREIYKYPGIKVELKTNINDVAGLEADEVIIATGSSGLLYGVEA